MLQRYTSHSLRLHGDVHGCQTPPMKWDGMLHGDNAMGWTRKEGRGMRLLINTRKEEVGDGLDQISYDFYDWFVERLIHYQVFERQVIRDLHMTQRVIMRKKLKELFGVEEEL